MNTDYAFDDTSRNPSPNPRDKARVAISAMDLPMEKSTMIFVPEGKALDHSNQEKASTHPVFTVKFTFHHHEDPLQEKESERFL
ncbi:uncharacterized protein LOC143644781 isoform X2 [Tamandua tetradactyla]|uniref:uncharacterized protein LOC143644781 isoform X2 n=1 Tax=Tamandua tetradactyla TaxID=48850 RepID=UPI004053EFFE